MILILSWNCWFFNWAFLFYLLLLKLYIIYSPFFNIISFNFILIIFYDLVLLNFLGFLFTRLPDRLTFLFILNWSLFRILAIFILNLFVLNFLVNFLFQWFRLFFGYFFLLFEIILRIYLIFLWGFNGWYIDRLKIYIFA